MRQNYKYSHISHSRKKVNALSSKSDDFSHICANLPKLPLICIGCLLRKSD